MGKRESPKNTGVSDLGAFKLGHLQPVKLIWLQNISTFLPVSWRIYFSHFRALALPSSLSLSPHNEEMVYYGRLGKRWTIFGTKSA